MPTTIIQPITASPAFLQEDIAAAQGAAAVPLNASGTVGDYVQPVNGEIFGYSIALSDLLTAGSISIAGTIGGVPLSTLHVVNALSGSDIFVRETDGGRAFLATTRLGIQLQSDAALLPAGSVDVAIIIYTVLNRGVSTDND